MPSRRAHYPRRKPAEPEPPPNITPELTARVVAHVTRCVPLERAAAAEGIGSSELNAWLRKGANLEQPFRRFREAVLAAEAEAHAGLVSRVHTAGRQDVRANQWLLERLDRKTFGRDQNAALELLVERLLDALEAEFEDNADVLARALAAIHRAIGGEATSSARDEGDAEDGR